MISSLQLRKPNTHILKILTVAHQECFLSTNGVHCSNVKAKQKSRRALDYCMWVTSIRVKMTFFIFSIFCHAIYKTIDPEMVSICNNQSNLTTYFCHILHTGLWSFTSSDAYQLLAVDTNFFFNVFQRISCNICSGQPLMNRGFYLGWSVEGKM